MKKTNAHRHDQNLKNKTSSKIRPQYSKEESPDQYLNAHENAHSRNQTELNITHTGSGLKKNS